MGRSFWVCVPGLGVIVALWLLLIHKDTNAQNLASFEPYISNEEPLVSERNRILQQVDEETLKRYKAAPSGYRRHPSYYSDRYLTRGGPVSNQSDLDKWGRWTLEDQKRSTRPGDDFYLKYPNRDVPWDDFPDNAWQKDTEYLTKFLNEGIALVDRALEAILTEYGYGKDVDDRPFEERIKLLSGVNSLGTSYKGLVRRILHAVVTEDTFTFAMAGHSAAAAHGNLFQQSYTHAYGVITEPIFARLGVHATSRNFGFGGLGTLQTGIATSALVGRDVDLLMWDSGMTEKGNPVNILGLQAIMSGDRIPYYLVRAGKGTNGINELNKYADADTGILQGVGKFTPRADTEEQLEALPWAAQCLSFGPELRSVCNRSYRGHCWFDRSHFEWAGMNMSFVPESGNLNGQPGGRASWHPGDKVHQQIGRAIAGFVLSGLRDALLLWKNAQNLTLNNKDWHVTAYYDNIRNKAKTALSATAKSWCKGANLPERVCQVRMQAATEFTPRYDPVQTSIRHLMKVSNSQLKPKASVYDPPDVYIPDLHPPPGSLDVLQIVENGIEFASNFGRIRRRDSLLPADLEPRRIGSSVNSEIVAGKGWSIARVPTGTDMCDGENDSWCKRGYDNGCLLYAHNDHRGEILFDSLSGWGIFELPNMVEGIIIIKYHDWMPANVNPATKQWKTENDMPEASNGRYLGKEDVSEATDGRNLKSQPAKTCEDFLFEFAIDGVITSWDKAFWYNMKKRPQRVVEISTLLDDPSFIPKGKSKNVELAMRITGCGREKAIALTHIYWA